MLSTTNSTRMSFGGWLPLLGLFKVLQIGAVSQAEEPKDKTNGLPCDTPAGQNAAQAEQDAKQKSRLVTGEVMQIDGENFVIKEKDGKEVRFQLTETTEKPPIQQGDRISVAFDSQNRGPDRRRQRIKWRCLSQSS